MSWLHLPTEDGIHERLVGGHTIPAIGPRGTGNFQLSCRDRFHRTLGSIPNLTSFDLGPWSDEFRSIWMQLVARLSNAVGDSTPLRFFWIACVTEYQSAWVFLTGVSGYWACPAFPVPEAGSLDISKNYPWDSEQFGAALIPRCISMLCLKSSISPLQHNERIKFKSAWKIIDFMLQFEMQVVHIVLACVPLVLLTFIRSLPFIWSLPVVENACSTSCVNK